jgi:hypothetical protein
MPPQPPMTPSPAPRGTSADCRCVCGSLVARLVEGGVELKCRRCKRTLVVPLAPEAAADGSATVALRRAG